MCAGLVGVVLLIRKLLLVSDLLYSDKYPFHYVCFNGSLSLILSSRMADHDPEQCSGQCGQLCQCACCPSCGGCGRLLTHVAEHLNYSTPDTRAWLDNVCPTITGSSVSPPLSGPLTHNVLLLLLPTSNALYGVASCVTVTAATQWLTGVEQFVSVLAAHNVR